MVPRLPRATGAFAIAVGSLVLIGWATDNDLLKGAGHRITMKANAALGLIVCGISLVTSQASSAFHRRISIAAAVLAGVLGALTLSEHAVGWNLGIDELLFHEAPGAAATASPGRMGLNASTSLLLASAALLALRSRSPRWVTAAQFAASAMTVLATIALVGYLYGAEELYSAARYTGVAWPTAVTFLVISLGILAVRSEAGPIAVLVGGGSGGIMARRLLILAIAVPLVFGYMRVLGQRAELYDTGFGAAIFAVAMMVMFTIGIWRTAAKLDETARAREAVQRERDHLLVRERAAREEAERSSRLKDEFLATMSHELRTPLNTLLGWTEMLRSDAILGSRRAHAVDVISRNGRLLVRLVEDLLDFSRIATGRLHLNAGPVDLAVVLTSVTEAIAGEAAAKGLSLLTRTPADGATVEGDRERLQQIIGNLLSNAVKFTPNGGSVEAEIVTSSSAVTLRVSDTGVGIDPDFLPHVFERFRQADGTPTREHGGLGIGLSIVRELAELHGGSVEAFSAGRGHGSTFTVTFPTVVHGRARATR